MTTCLCIGHRWTSSKDGQTLRFLFLKLIDSVENAYLMFLKGTVGSPTVHFAPIWLLHTVLLMHFKAPWTMQESPIYHHVDGSLLYQSLLSEKSVNFSIF